MIEGEVGKENNNFHQIFIMTLGENIRKKYDLIKQGGGSRRHHFNIKALKNSPLMVSTNKSKDIPNFIVNHKVPKYYPGKFPTKIILASLAKTFAVICIP